MGIHGPVGYAVLGVKVLVRKVRYSACVVCFVRATLRFECHTLIVIILSRMTLQSVPPVLQLTGCLRSAGLAA